MLLRDVIYSLETGELQNLSCVDNETGEFKSDYYGRVVTSVNHALSDLHTRFLLKKGTVVVSLKEGQVTYPLQQRFVITDPSKPEQFITGDSVRQLLKILEVKDDKGVVLPLNNGDPRKGIETPTFNVMNVSTQLYKEWDVKQLTVQFQRNANLICTGYTDIVPEFIDLDIDARFLSAICLYVASRLHNVSGFGTGGIHEGNNYHSLYLEECARLANTGQAITEVMHGNHRRQGFP